MDEGTLNDLLECSVCLDRLDTSSKVLPCQHTFCRKCLQEIVHKHKELRCPECRVLVNVKVDDLPPNVLLMRILEGMRNNAGPKKQQQRVIKNQQSPAPVHQTLHPQPHSTPERTTAKQNPTQFGSHQPYAKAVYDYTSKEIGDLNFKKGDIIILKKRIDTHWYQGECGGNQGVFPLSYVQIITPLPSHIPQCKALYDFRMNNDEEEGCLAFNKSDIINVIRRVDENWAEGKLDGRIGIFPLAFVELNNLARSLMKLSTNAQPGPSKVAPPTPTTEDSTPLIPTDHSRTVIQQNLIASDSNATFSSGSSSTTTTPNVSSSNTSSSSSTAPSSPASPSSRRPRIQLLPRNVATPKPDLLNTGACKTPQISPNNVQENQTSVSSQQHSNNKEKRHSFTGLTPSHQNKTNHRHSTDLSEQQQTQLKHNSEKNKRGVVPPTSNTNEITLPAAHTALYPYKPQKSDELELRKGGVYMVTERCQDGWFKGTSIRTQKCGVFPGNYVVPARNIIGSSSNAGESSTSTAVNDKTVTVSYARSGGVSRHNTCLPPELPPRSVSPAKNATTTISASWHGQQDNASVQLGRSSSAVMSTNAIQRPKAIEKNKERKDKGTVSLMRRLTSIKRSKSPPSLSTYSMDNPVFDDSSNNMTTTTSTTHPVHVRSGSCPSQLLHIPPPTTTIIDHHRMFGSSSQRHKHRERPNVLSHNARKNEAESITASSSSSTDVSHRKSNSLDAGNRNGKTGVQTVRERFRCIAPYPPNSEYELELHVNDIIYVHKKRDDGWYKGTQQRTGRTGLFPASFVEGF